MGMVRFTSPMLFTVKHKRERWELLARHRGEVLAWFLRRRPGTPLDEINIELATFRRG